MLRSLNGIVVSSALYTAPQIILNIHKYKYTFISIYEKKRKKKEKMGTKEKFFRLKLIDQIFNVKKCVFWLFDEDRRKKMDKNSENFLE